MAQTAKTTRKRASGSNGSSSRASSTSKKRSGSRTSANGSASRARKPASTNTRKSSPRSKPRSSAQSANGSGSIAGAAAEKTKGAAHAISEAASKAKVPLIAGGTALAGAAAGAVIKGRLGAKRSKSPLSRLRGVSLPSPANLNLGELDLDRVKRTAERVSAYGQQASDIATAAQKTRKKNS